MGTPPCEDKTVAGLCEPGPGSQSRKCLAPGCLGLARAFSPKNELNTKPGALPRAEMSRAVGALRAEMSRAVGAV